MTFRTDIAVIDERMLGLGEHCIRAITSGAGTSTTVWDPKTGRYQATTILAYMANGSAGPAALIAAMFHRTRPFRRDWYDQCLQTVERGMLGQQAQDGFFNDTVTDAWLNSANGSETMTGHLLVNFATVISTMRPYIPTWLFNKWMAAYKRALDRLWAVDGNGAGSGSMWWVNGNYNLCFAGCNHWYGQVSGDATYTTRGDVFFDFLLNGTTTTTPTLTPSGQAIAGIPGWPAANGNFAHPQFAGYGLWFDTAPVQTDWSDAVGHLVETNTVPLNPVTITNSYDPNYTNLQREGLINLWRLTGDIRYKRLFYAVHNKLVPRTNLTTSLIVVKPDNTVAAVKNITGAIAGTGGAIQLTVAAHGYANGLIVRIIAAPGGVTGVAAGGEYTVQNTATNTFELASTTFGGAYTSGGTVQEGHGISPFGINGYGGTRQNSADSSDGAEYFVPTVFGSTSYSSSAILVPQMTIYGPGGALNCGVIEQNHRGVADGNGNPGGYRAFGLNVADYLMWLELAIQPGLAAGRGAS